MKKDSAWNPGLDSDIPHDLWPEVTLFRGENASVAYPAAKELADLTGLNILEFIALRPHRLVVHALLVRVTADLYVPDGPNYEDLGLNIRKMVKTIDTAYMQPDMPRIESAFNAEKSKAVDFVTDQLATQLSPPEIKLHKGKSGHSPIRQMFSRWFSAKSARARPAQENESVEIHAINAWKLSRETCQDPLQCCCLDALIRTVGAAVGHRGRLLLDPSVVTSIVVNQVANTHGAQVIETCIEPLWTQAISKEKYKLLPAQTEPVIMNVKGASASGKSTIRPQQRKLAEKLGIPWSDFALISPDYWRKYLLDYGSLGEHYKYSAMLTGQELEMIDKKLDQYMADKAARGAMSHLLIDRFRFDSFTIDIDSMPDSRLLSRFGDCVYLFFVVTHPAETVERAWSRGLKTGRYKAVDDLLYHNVEAFTGMPSLFLSWVNSKGKKIHFEFLDNDVPEGSLPRTAAFGCNSSMTILDIELLFNIDKYRKVNIAAKQADQIFDSADNERASNTDFITRCARKVCNIVFADRDSSEIYASVKDGKLVWWDEDYLSHNADNDALTEIFKALGYTADSAPVADMRPDKIDVDDEKRLMVGRWS